MSNKTDIRWDDALRLEMRAIIATEVGAKSVSNFSM